MRLVWRRKKKQNGLIEVLPLVLLAVFAAFTFVIAATVQKQQQDIRSRATGVYPSPQVTPTPYCSKFMKDDCSFGCIETLNGGVCRTAPPPGTITPRPTAPPTSTAAPLANRITLTPTTTPTRTPTPAGPTMRYSVIGGQCRAIYGGGYATLNECVAALNRQLAASLAPTSRLTPTPTPDTSCLAQCRGTTGSEAVRCLTECRRNEGAISVTTPTRTPTPAATLTLIPTRTPTATITPRPTPTPVCQFSLLGFCLFGGATPLPTRIPTSTSTPRPTGTLRPTVTMTPQPTTTATPTRAPTLAVGDRCVTGFLGIWGNTCQQCPNGAYTINPAKRITECGVSPTGSPVAVNITPTPTLTRTPTAPPPRFGSGGTPQPSVTVTGTPSPTRAPTAPPPRFGSGGTPQPSITVTQSPTPTLSPGANCVTGIFGWGDTCSRCPYGYAASTSRRGLFCNPAPGVTINEGVTPSPATPIPTYNACSAQEFAGYTSSECTRRGGRPRAIGGSTVCCTLPGRTPTPPPGTAPAGSLALGATCNVSSECRSGFCDWHMTNGLAAGKQCSPAPTVTPTPTFAVLPSVTPTPTPLPIEAGSCSGGVPINGCARAQNNRWVRCSAGRGQGNSGGRYTYPYYVEDASCARVDLALVGGGTLTVQLESDTASTDLTADRIQCLNISTFGASCDNVSFGSCTSDKKYVCDCTYYRYPTFRAATGSEQGSCSTERPLFTTRSVASALQEQAALQQTRQASCARGCAVGGSIYGAGYCASAVSQCQCNESTGWQPRLVTVTQDDCRAGGTTTQQIGSAFNTSSGYFCGDDGNVYQNRQSPQLVSFCRNSGLICGQRSTGQIECRGASSLDELANAGLGGSPDIYECIGTTAYRVKSRPSETTRCPTGTTCQTSEGAVQCAPTDQSWQQFLASYQTSAQAASQCSGGGNHGDSRGSGASAETCMCNVSDNAIVPGSCSWRGSAQVATQVLQQSNYPQSYITAFQSYQRDHPGATLADFQQAQVAAFDRIRPTLVNLGVLDQAYMDRITSGEYVPTEIERTLGEQRQNLGARILLGLNNLTSGATLRGNNLLLQGEETWRSGDYINGANQIVRGALIQGAAPATLAVAIAALPALPLAGAISGGLIIPSALTGVLTFGGTAVGIAGTTYSLQHTAEACAPGTLATRECAFAAGNTAFAALSTGVGVAAGSLQLAAQANMARSGLALAQGAGAASDAMTGATIANATGRAATIASWNKAVALGGTVLFGSQAIESCTQGVPDDPNNPDGPRHIDTLNCAVNTAMALTSAARFVGASAGLNPASLPNKSVEVLDVGVNSTQAIIACAGGAAQRDLTGCAQAVSGALLSAGGAYAAGTHAGNLADTPTARFEEARQALTDLYVDPNASAREAQLRPGITPEQVTVAETAMRQAILVRAQERAAVDLALRPIGGSEPDWTASQRTLRTAQQDYQAALAAYERLADKPLAERLVSAEYRAYQQALDRLVTTKATVNVEATALRSPRNPLQQLGDRVVKPPEVDAFQRAQDDFRRVATTVDPQSLEYRQALDRLLATQQSVRELTYNRTQQEITAELRPRQEELRNRQGDLTTLREENALLADPAKAQQAVRDAQVALEEARTRRAGVSGEAAVNADLVIRQIEQKLARAQELSRLATDYANGVPDAVQQVTDRQLREQTVGRQVSVLNAEAARLEGARVRAGTVQGWLADRLLGTPKNPNAFAEVFLGRTSAEVQLTRQLVADQVGRTQAERLVAEARSRVEQNAGLSLNDAVNQVFAEKGRAGVRQEVFDAAASALRQSGITDEAVIIRRAGLIADSVTDTLWSGRDRLATSVTSGLAPAQSLDFRLRPTGLAAVGAAITGAGGAVGRSAAGAVIGVSDSLSDLGSNLRVRGEAEPATLTPEARNLVGRLAQLQTERGVTALDSAGEGTSRNALLSAGSEQITTPDGKTATRTRFELTDAGRTAGFTEGDIRLLNQVTRAFEDFQASQNPNFERIRAGTGDFRDQARFVVSALETFGAKGSRGAVFGALPGMGKTDVVMPLNILLQARMTADPQFVVFPDGPLMEQFLRNDGAGNRAMVRFYEQSLGPDSVLVVRQGDPPPTPEQIGRAKVIVTTRDVAFTLRETDTPTGAAMRDRWRNSYIHGDEAHWTLNPFESYQITAGEQRRVLQTSEGSGFVQAKDEVTRLAVVRELIDARIQGRQPEGVTKSPDGRSGVYTPETELRILREWLATRDSAGILPAELKPLVNSTDLPTIQRELNRFLDTNPTQAAGPLGRELTIINRLADVLAAVPGNDYGPSSRGNEMILAPREQGKITGRQYQSIPEQILYNTVGAEITGSRVDLNILTVSSQSRDINYALLMFEAKGFALYTGTPELVARMYEQAYGVNLRTFSDSAFDTVSARLTTGQQAGTSRVFSTLADAVRSGEPNRNPVYVNMDTSRANSIVTAEVARLHPDQRLFVVGGNGEFIEYTTDSSGRLTQVQTYPNREALNVRTSALDNAGGRYVKIYEYGAHTGVDTFNDVARSRGIVIAGSDINQTTFAQGVNRLRPDASGTYPPIDIVYLGADRQTVRTPTELMTDLNTRLAVNEARSQALGEIQFKETLLRNSVDIMFDRLISRAGETRLLGLVRPDQDMVARLQSLQDSWKRTSELAYRLGSGEVDAQTRLQRTLAQVQALYRQVGSVVGDNPNVAAEFNRQAQGFDSATINFVATQTQETSFRVGQPPTLRDIVRLINSTTSTERFAGVTFTERGAGPQVITADAAASARAVNVISDIDSGNIPPAVGGGPRVEAVTPQARQQQIAAQVRQQEFARLETRFPILAYQPIAVEAVAAGLPTSEVRVRVVEALNRGYTSDIVRANFDAWVNQFAAGLVGRAILPKVAEDLATGQTVSSSDLLLAHLGSQDLSVQNQVSVPQALPIPVGGQFRVVDNNAQTQSVPLAAETKIEFGVTRLTTTVYSAPLTVGQDQKIDLSALPADANLVRLTTKDGTQYTVTKDDFLVQVEQQAVTAAVTQQATTVLTTQPLVPQVFGLRKTGFNASDLQTPKGQAVVKAVINLQTAVATGTYQNSADVLGAIDYQSLIRALFDLSQTAGRYRGVSATAVADAAIVAAGGSQNLLTGKQQPGRIGGAPVSTFFGRVGEAARALFGRLGQVFAGIRLPGGGSQALSALGNWLGQRLTDLGNFFAQVTGGLPTFFRRINGEAVRDLFLWKPLSGLMTSPRVPQRTKNILAGGRDGVAEVVFNATPFGIGRSNWNLRNAAIDTAAYFFTRNIPYAGVVLSIYDGARIVRWVTEKVTGVQSPLRIQPPAPKETPPGEEQPAAEEKVVSGTPVILKQPKGWEGVVVGQDTSDERYYRIQITKGNKPEDIGAIFIRARGEFEITTPAKAPQPAAAQPVAPALVPAAPAPVVAPPVKLPSGPLVVPQRFDLPQAEMMIGRSDQAQIRLPMAVDTQVSRQHARIAFASGGFNLIDLGSLHGTFILRGNQEIKVPTAKPVTLVRGDIILLARNGTYFRFLGNALDGPHFDGKQALVQLAPAPGRVDKVLAGKLFSDKPMLEALRDRIEGLIFDLDLKEAQNVINDELRSVLEDEGLRGSDLETAKNQLAVRLNVASIIDDLKARIEVRSRASDMTVPLISRPRYDRVGRLPANLRPVQQYKYEYVSSGGQKLRIDLVNDPELREMVDRAIREIAEIRDKSRSFLGGPPSKSRLDALAEWVNREVNYNKNIQQKIYDAGGGQAGLGQIVCNGGVCREKSFLVDLLARELGIQSEVWVFDFNGGGRHAINYFPQRQLIVDATNETQALTVAEYENRAWVRRIGGINWSSVLRFGHQDAIAEEENARPAGGGRPLYSNPILQVTTGAIRAPLELLGKAVDPQAQTFIGRLAKAAVGVDDYATGRDTLEAQRYQETVVSPWNNFWQSQFDNLRDSLSGATGVILTSNNLLGRPLRQLLTLIAPNIVPPPGPAAPQEVSRGPPPPTTAPPAAVPPVSITKPMQEVLTTLSLNISRLQSLPNAQTITSFVTRRLIDPGFQKILPSATLPQDLVIYENDAVVSAPRHQEILANYQNNRPGLPIFSSFVLKRLLAAGYQAVNLDIRNLASANEVGGSPNGIVGDYLIYDTIAAIQKELGEDYLLVRAGGDEFTVLARQPFTTEVTAKIQAAAGSAQSLFIQSGRVVYKPSQVKVTVTSPADLAEADVLQPPPEELSPGLRMNRLNAYHPELRPITDAIVTIQDQAELGNFLAFFEEALFDPVLQKEAQQLSAGGKNVEVYVNRTDYINHLQSRSGALRLVRIDLPGALKRINDNHSYTVGNDFLTYEFGKIVAAVAKYQNNIIVFRRGGDFYVALPDNQDLVNTVSGEIESAIRGESGSYLAEDERITLIPALASVKLNLELVKERTPEVSSTNERAFAVAQEQLAQEVWRATIMQLQRFYSVEHRSPDWEFLLRYLDPYDRRGNNRLVRMATPFIADLQKLYYDPAVDSRSGVREGQVEAAKQQLLQILQGYQYPQPPLDVTETQTKIKTFESRVPAPLRLVRVGRDYVTSAYNQVRDGLIQNRRAVDKAVLPEVFQGKELYQVLAENNTEFEVVPFAVQSMEQVRDTMFRNLRELGFPTEAAMVEKVYSWHAEAIREAETRRGRPEYPGFSDELVRTIERANRNNYNHMMTVVLRSLEVAAAGRLTRAEASLLLKAALWHDISKPWTPDGRRGTAALAAAAAKDAQTPGAVSLGMHLGDLLTHPQESSQMVADHWQDFGLASPEEAARVARIIGAHWGRDPFYIGVLKGQVASPESLPVGERLLAAMLDTADNSANTGPFEALKIVTDELVQGGFRQPVKTIAQALKGYLKSVIGYYDSNYLPEYGRVIIGNNIREIARMINWIEADPQQLSFMLETYDLAAGRPEQNRLNAGFAASTFAIILKNYDEVRRDPHFDLLDIDVTPEGEVKRVTDPVAHLVARYEAAFKEPFFTQVELAARPQTLAAYAAENLALARLNQEKFAHTFVVQLWERLFRRRQGLTSVSPGGPPGTVFESTVPAPRSLVQIGPNYITGASELMQRMIANVLPSRKEQDESRFIPRSQEIEPLERDNFSQNRDSAAYNELKDSLNFIHQNYRFYRQDDPTVVELQGHLDRLIANINEERTGQKLKPIPKVRLLITVNDKWPNAFSYFDGTIVLNQSLINLLHTPGEIMAILTHEVSHFEDHFLDWSAPIEKLALGPILVNRMQEYKADLVKMSRRLKKLGFSGLSMKRALEALSGYYQDLVRTQEKKPAKRINDWFIAAFKIDTPPEVEVKTDLEHGSIANRILLQILSSYVLEVGGEDVVDNRTIPENWKRLTTQDTPYEQLLRERNQSRWEQLFRVAPPLVVRKYAREYPNLLKQSIESSIAWQEVSLRYRKDRPQQAYNALRYRQAILNFENLVAKRKIIAKVFLAKLGNMGSQRTRDLERLLLGGGRKAPYNDLSLTIQKLQKFAAGFSSRWYLPDGKQIAGGLLTLLELRDEDFTPEAIARLEDRASWKPIYEKLGLEFSQDYQPLAVLYADFQTILHHQDILTKRFGKPREIGVPIIDLYERYLDYLLSLPDPEEDHFVLALATANNIIIELYARETLTYNQELADRGVAVYKKILQKYPQRRTDIRIFDDLAQENTFSRDTKYLDKLQYYKRWADQLGVRRDFSEEEEFYLAVKARDEGKIQAFLRQKPVRLLALTQKGGERNVFQTADWDWIKQQYGNFIDSSDYHSANWTNDENMPVYLAPFDFEYRVRVDWTSAAGSKERIEKAWAIQQKYQALLKSLAGAEGLRWVFGRYMSMAIGSFGSDKIDYYLQNTTEIHGLPIMQIAREWILANVAAGNISARVGYHAAVDLLKSTISVYRGTMPFVGRNQVEAAYLQPIIVFYLQEIRRSMPTDFPEDFITANEFYQTVKELPVSGERDALLDDMRLAMVKKLPFADVLKFVRNELDEEDGSADVVSYFLENRIQTYDEYSEAKGYFGENFINDLSHKSSAKLGLGVILDTVMSNILQPDTTFEFFEAAMTGNDLKLREIVAKEYYSITKGRKLREHGIELTGEDKLVGPLADTYPLLNELMEEIYAMPKAKKFLLLTKLLVDDNAGVLHQEKNYQRIVALVMGRMESDPKVNPLLRKVTMALLNQRLGKEKVALGVANSILDVFLQRPKNLIPDKVKDNNGQIAQKIIDKQYEVMDKIPFWVRLIPRRFWPYDWQIQVDSAERQQRQQKDQTTRLARLFNVSRVDVLNDPENRDPVIVSLRSQIQNTIRDLGEAARPLAERPEAKQTAAPEKITAVSAIIQVAQALGAVGVRFLQVLGQYYPIDPVMQKEFQNVYDNASFLYMANAFQTTEQALRTYEEEIVRLENGQARSQKPEQDLQKIEEYSLEAEHMREYLEKMYVIEKIGGGSIVTVYKTTMITPDGWVSLDAKDADVFKITNPNILERLEDDLGLIRSVVAELLNIDPRRLTEAELNPQKRQEYITARRLLNTLGDWIGEDVKDPNYLTLDSIYSATHKNYVAPNGMRVDVSRTKSPYNRWVKVEGFVDGATLNSLINELTNNDPAKLKDLQTPEAQRARKTVQALVYDYTRHLFEPVDLPDGRKAVVTHSDIHAGNVITSRDKDLATLIDRNYYLVLQPQDILLIQHLFGGKASDREKLASLINYLLLENRVLGLRAAYLKAQLYLAILRLGPGQMTPENVVTVILQEMDRYGLEVPLRMRLFVKNMKAINRLLSYLGNETLDDYIKYYAQNRQNEENVQEMIRQTLLDMGVPAESVVGKLMLGNFQAAFDLLERELQAKRAVEEKSEEINSFKNPDCLSLNPLVSRVWAASGEEGNTCPWYLRAPYKVVKELWQDKNARKLFLALLADQAIRLGIRILPYVSGPGLGELPPYKNPPPPTLPITCTQGSCQEGCNRGFQCNKDSGCCELITGYTDTICSSDGKVEIHRRPTGDDDIIFENTDIKACDASGCVDNRCRQYARDEDFKNVGACSELPSGYSYNMEQSSYLPAIPCRETDGSLGWRFGIPDNELKNYACSDDLSAIVRVDTGKAVHTCDSQSKCFPIPVANGSHPDCIPLRLLRGAPWITEGFKCSPYVERNDGFICKLDGLHCQPGQVLPKTTEFPCDRICKDQDKTDLKRPLDCSLTQNSYIDYVCKKDAQGKSGVYEVDSSSSSLQPKFIKQCVNNACTDGMCAASPGESCNGLTEGEFAMRKDGKCVVQCVSGVFQNTSSCDKVNVISYNNKGKQIIYETLAKLPPQILNSLAYSTLRHSWLNTSLDIKIPRLDLDLIASGFAFLYIDLANLSNYDSQTQQQIIVHEVMHEWAYAAETKLPRWVPFSDPLNFGIYLATNGPTVPVSSVYRELVGCGKVQGGFSYNLQPVTGYGYDSPRDSDNETNNKPVATECGEDFADSAAWYVARPCDLKQKSAKRYEYFKNTIFQGKEYVPSGGCPAN